MVIIIIWNILILNYYYYIKIGWGCQKELLPDFQSGVGTILGFSDWVLNYLGVVTAGNEFVNNCDSDSMVNGHDDSRHKINILSLI